MLRIQYNTLGLDENVAFFPLFTNPIRKILRLLIELVLRQTARNRFRIITNKHLLAKYPQSYNCLSCMYVSLLFAWLFFNCCVSNWHKLKERFFVVSFVELARFLCDLVHIVCMLKMTGVRKGSKPRFCVCHTVANRIRSHCTCDTLYWHANGQHLESKPPNLICIYYNLFLPHTSKSQSFPPIASCPQQSIFWSNLISNVTHEICALCSAWATNNLINAGQGCLTFYPLRRSDFPLLTFSRLTFDFLLDTSREINNHTHIYQFELFFFSFIKFFSLECQAAIYEYFW